MKILEKLKELWPDASDEARDSLIWVTPYPFVNLETLIETLRNMREKWGPDISAAINGEMKEIEDQWEEYKKTDDYKNSQPD